MKTCGYVLIFAGILVTSAASGQAQNTPSCVSGELGAALPGTILIKESVEATSNVFPGPGAPKSDLRVSGKLRVPSAGWKTTTRLSRTGINPAIAIVLVTAISPRRKSAPCLSEIDFAYSGKGPNSNTKYKNATVRVGKEEVTVPIKNIQ